MPVVKSGLMTGEERAARIASDLLDVKLIYRAALERRGHTWQADAVAGEPAAVFVSLDGRPTFVYGLPVTSYAMLPGRRLEKTALVGSLVCRGVYNETGQIIERSM